MIILHTCTRLSVMVMILVILGLMGGSPLSCQETVAVTAIRPTLLVFSTTAGNVRCSAFSCMATNPPRRPHPALPSEWVRSCGAVTI
jgi:hypothetical protein